MSDAAGLAQKCYLLPGWKQALQCTVACMPGIGVVNIFVDVCLVSKLSGLAWSHDVMFGEEKECLATLMGYCDDQIRMIRKFSFF